MMNIPIVSRFGHNWPEKGLHQPDLRTLYERRELLPAFVRDCALSMHCLELFGPLAWDRFPERDLERNWGQTTVSYAAYTLSYLYRLDQGLGDMARVRFHLVHNPGLVWLFGFPLHSSRHSPTGFDAETSLPTHRHFTRMLRQMPNAVLQFLLDSSVALLVSKLHAHTQEHDPPVGDCVSIDTKHILAWVKENNPKTYVEGRCDKTRQPKGDPDCKLGCKRRRNQRPASQDAPSTPTSNPSPGSSFKGGDFYWGYASGIAATKIEDCCEFVLAELTQPLNSSDVSYFFPLMNTVERRLGFRPKFGALDAAFDSFYVYEYFYNEGRGGFAAVPLVHKGSKDKRLFDEDGLPLCQAGFSMPLKFTFTDRTRTLIEHQRGKHVCPLFYPEPTGQDCPAEHKRWAKGGCTADLPTCKGARIRHQLDRDSDAYKKIYKQRTAAERIFSQALQLGIERPHIRNGQAIANLNTLIYVLINLRALQRISQNPQTGE